MVIRRRTAAVAGWVPVFFSAGVVAKKKDEPKKQDEAQKKEILSVVKVVDDVAAGQPAPNDLSVAWAREDFLKAQGNKEYVPFTVTIDPSKVGGGNVALYWRVVSKNAAAAAPEPAPDVAAKKDDKSKDKDKDKKKADYAYEDITFVPVTAAQNPMRISRSFTVPAGAYDVFVVAKEPTPTQKNAPEPKMSVLKN